MSKLPFFIGNILACFVPDSHKRHVVRGWVNCILYSPRISLFLKRIYGCFAYKIKFVRQHSPDRCVCIVNDEYYVKIFKKVPAKKICAFAMLTNYVGRQMKINIPHIFASEISSIYTCRKIPGRNIYDFDKQYVLDNEEKILNQVAQLINDLQKIDIRKIPKYERFACALQSDICEEITPTSVLGHFDMNETNFLFDDDLNICGLIDWDSMHITNDVNKDMQIFMKYWNRYKETK